MSDLSSGQAKNQLSIIQASLPSQFSVKEWGQHTEALDPISRGQVLANIYFRAALAKPVEPHVLRHELPSAVLRACLRLMHGNDKLFVEWLENPKINQSELLPVYPAWSQTEKRKFTLIAAAVDQDSKNWMVLFVLRDEKNYFIAPKLSRRQPFLSVIPSTVSNKHFIGVLFNIFTESGEVKNNTSIGASILAEPEIEKTCLEDVGKGKAKVADLIESCYQAKFPDARYRSVESFFSTELREGFFVLKDKVRDQGLLLAKYTQHAGVLGNMNVDGPFSAFDSARFREIYKNSFPVDLESTKKNVMDSVDRASDYKDLSSGVESSHLDLWAAELLKHTLDELVTEQNQSAPEDLKTHSSLLRFKPHQPDNSEINWYAVIELQQSILDPNSRPDLINDHILLAIEVRSQNGNIGSVDSVPDYNSKLIKAFFSLDSFEQQLMLLASERPASSILYSTIMSKIHQEFKISFLENPAIDFLSVAYSFDPTQNKSLNLLVQHTLGYSLLKLNLSDDGSLLFQSPNLQYEAVKVSVSLYDNS